MSDTTKTSGNALVAGLTLLTVPQYLPPLVQPSSRMLAAAQDDEGRVYAVGLGMLDQDILQALNDLWHGLVDLAGADTSLGTAMAALTTAVSAGNALQTTRNGLAGTTNTNLASILAQEQANAVVFAAMQASNLRQEALLQSIVTGETALHQDQATAHSDALAELSAIQATNAALATAHQDALNALAAANATNAALGLIHADEAATKAALDLLHTDENGLLAALNSLISATATENAALSAISLSDAGTLATLKAILAGGTPFSASPAAGGTATLFQAGANGSTITALGATSTALTGTLLLTIFSSSSSTATSGTVLETVELLVGSNAPVLQNVAVPANAYVRTTANLAGATVFGARKDL